MILFLFLPNLIHSSDFYSKDYEKMRKRVGTEWNRHQELIEQFSNLNLTEKEQNIALLYEAIACCERGIKYCDKILKEIADKRREERHYPFWIQAKNQSLQDRNALYNEITGLHSTINQTLAFAQATRLFQEGEKKAILATDQAQDPPKRYLDNVEEIVAYLNHIGKLYEEAATLTHQALNLLLSYPDESSKNTLKEAIDVYQNAATLYQKEALQWPEKVMAQQKEQSE